MILPSREIAVVLFGVLVRSILLAFGEVATPLVVDAGVASLLSLGEVAPMLLLDGLALFLLAGREAAVSCVLTVVEVLTVVVVRTVVVVLAVVMVVVVVMTVIVVGMFAHARVSQAMRVRPLWTAGQPAASRFSASRTVA